MSEESLNKDHKPSNVLNFMLHLGQTKVNLKLILKKIQILHYILSQREPIEVDGYLEVLKRLRA
jgi:hypothetical protein